MTDSGHPTPRTEGEDYTERLTTLASARWKQVLDVQRPYRWNLRRLHLGRTLDVGCGIGRNLVNLGSNSVGVDHNPTSIAACRAQGLEAYTTEEFRSTDIGAPGAFDALLAATCSSTWTSRWPTTSSPNTSRRSARVARSC